MSKIKVFEWCDGMGMDVLCEEDWRSRVLFSYDGSVGMESTSIVGWLDSERFVEVLAEYSLWEYVQKVYDVITEIV